jgi:multiple sugar transport system ATP-binding protein
MTMADRIVVMYDGIIEQIGTPLELYDRPANLFVAGFIGSPAMNMIKGKIDGDSFVADNGTRIPLSMVPGNSAGRSVTLGVRPEHLSLDPDGVDAEVLTV